LAEECLQRILICLNEIQSDNAVPKNIRVKICTAIESLNENDKSLALKINRSLEGLEEASNDPNIPMDIRSRIWEVLSLLSSI